MLAQGFGAAAVATAWVTWRRAAGEATPGQRWAIVMVPVTTVWALVRPLQKHLPVFPYAFGGDYGNWTTSSAGWTVTGLAAALILAAILARDGRPWHRTS